MNAFLFQKIVDQSLLKNGLTIPADMQDKIQEAVGVQLSKGQRAAIKILIGDRYYNASLSNVNFKAPNANRTVFQIRYSEGSPIAQKLKSIFPSFNQSSMKRMKEYIEVYSNDDHTLEFKVNNTVKEAFFKYIGTKDSLTGYQRSYKLVFYKAFFTRLIEKRETNCNDIATDFRQYYLNRKKAGLVPDVNVDPVIDNVEQSTIQQINNLILRNPFNAISNQGFILKENDQKERYVLCPELRIQLSSNEIRTIIDIVNQKLELYYSSVDKHKGASMREIVEKILNEYIPATKEPFSNHPLGAFFRHDIPQMLYNTEIVDSNNYLITGSVGQGNWAMVPWVCIFDQSITTSATRGVYIAYLLEKNGNSLYLTFNQGCTDIRNSHTKRETITILREKSAEIIKKIDSRGFRTDEDINLGDNLTELGELYQKGTIFYKEYKKDAIPSEEELREDLGKMMDIYREYAGKETFSTRESWLLTWNPNNYSWDDYLDQVSLTQSGNTYECEWSCTNTHVSPGDRVFLVVLGCGEKNGIVASGIAKSGSKETDHWDPAKNVQGIKTRMIDVCFDFILDYMSQDILKQSVLNSMFPDQQWSPQASGIEIKTQYKVPLEEEWERIINRIKTAGGDEEMTVKETIARIKSYIEAKGFSYEDGLIENFYLSLKSKPFVILAGTSGTGKTRLVRLFAEAVGANTDNGRYKMISVRPDWSDSSDLFGHVDLNGKFIPGAIIDFVKRAELDSAHPYFLCLDEMNLARVEYYLSDFLSVIETRDLLAGHIVSEPLVSSTYYGSDSSAVGKYGTVLFPENLYVIGTVNMDETTFPFSRKVLDRANTIEFSFVDLTPPVEWAAPTLPLPMNVSNDFLKTEYLLLVQCANQQEDVNTYCVELQRINHILQQANAHVGYRVRDEIVFYLLNNKNADLLSENQAMDNEITLPRGIETKLRKVDWTRRDVLIGDLRSTAQLKACLEHKFYHIPVSQLKDENLPIRYIALYQSNRLFGAESGIRYYGEVVSCSRIRRREIHVLPKKSNDWYYYLEVKEWKTLSKPISIKERSMGRQFTNMFLLEHSTEAPELSIRSEEEYRLFSELKRALNSAEINDDGTNIGFVFGDVTIAFEDGKIHVYRDKKIRAEYEIQSFSHTPNAIFRSIYKEIND